MLSVERCLDIAQAFLDEMTVRAAADPDPQAIPAHGDGDGDHDVAAEPVPADDPGSGEGTARRFLRFEVVCHELTPTHVLVGYGAARDPMTGEREALAGNIPFAVDLGSGTVVEPNEAVPLIALWWPEMCLQSHAEMWLRGAVEEGAAIRPSGPLSDVRTIDAIRALRHGWLLNLKEAKTTVETMVERGVAPIDVDGLSRRLHRKAAREMMGDVARDLDRAGVRLEAGGIGVLPILEFIDGDAIVPEGEAIPVR